jgi:hypothetical protein
MPQTSRLDNEEIRNKVREYVKATGFLKDAWQLVPYKDKSGLFKYLEKHPDFHKELDRLKSFSSVKTNTDFIQKTIDGLDQHLSGPTKIHTVTDESGYVIAVNEWKNPPSRWALEYMLSKGSLLEESLLIFVASFTKFISIDEGLTPEIRATIYKKIHSFKQRELKELIHQGKQVKEEPAV